MNSLFRCGSIVLAIFALACGTTHGALLTASDKVIVFGELKCDGKPYSGAVVKLYDKDLLIDDLMAKNKSLKDGSFYLNGKGNDILGKVNPTLYIYHKCNKGVLSCKRENIYEIPKEYIFRDDKKARPLDAGRIELMLKPKDETYKCLPAKKRTI